MLNRVFFLLIFSFEDAGRKLLYKPRFISQELVIMCCKGKKNIVSLSRLQLKGLLN